MEVSQRNDDDMENFSAATPAAVSAAAAPVLKNKMKLPVQLSHEELHAIRLQQELENLESFFTTEERETTLSAANGDKELYFKSLKNLRRLSLIEGLRLSCQQDKNELKEAKIVTSKASLQNKPAVNLKLIVLNCHFPI
jgi:hypothetical protein